QLQGFRQRAASGDELPARPLLDDARQTLAHRSVVFDQQDPAGGRLVWLLVRHLRGMLASLARPSHYPVHGIAVPAKTGEHSGREFTCGNDGTRDGRARQGLGMATFTVTNLNDSGAGSLRAAIDASNAAGPGNTIEFTVSGTITLSSALSPITSTVAIIAGNTDTGNPPTVGIDFNHQAGLLFAAGSDGSQLVGLALGNAAGNGVTLEAGNIILNNDFIGLARDGSALGNSGDGVFVSASSTNNQIGYNPEAAILAGQQQAATGVVSNVISANGGNGISFH